MLLARIDGSATSTIRHPSVKGWKLAICQPIDEEGNELSTPLIAIDKMGAGLHQRVIISSDGAALREYVGDPQSPLRYMVTHIVDEAIA
ncbi:MAG: EutN/CcmL family microcompartment protein [Verrucomicrobia bacterium]|nr:EutN/CcmL family microcompartment protein [Verrucomicrobiota bacterium]MCH8510148.1 EutN/CcmL family microcompartment protein [Kiritimatiellia bacterium]